MLQSFTTQEIKGLIAKRTKTGRVKWPSPKGLAFEFKARGPIWEWQGRVGGRPRTIKLGSYAEMGIAEARVKASQINEDLAAGVDVHVKYGSGVPSQAPNARGVMTCQEAWDVHLERSTNKDSTKESKRGYWRCHWKVALGDKLVTEVTYDDLMDVVESIRDEGSDAAADTAIRYIKKFFSWAEQNPRITGLNETPARKLRAEAVTKRNRTLSEAELRWFWQAAGDLSPVWRDYFLTLLLTGLRRSEIRLLKRSEVNVDQRVLDFPAVRMKNNLPHIAPLGPKAWGIIERRLAATNSIFVYQSPVCIEHDAAIGGLSNAMKKLRTTVQELAGNTPVERWTMHDLRRTFSTMANGILDENEDSVLNENHIERVLAHKISGVASIYNRHQYFREKRRVMEVWEDEVCRIVGKEIF